MTKVNDPTSLSGDLFAMELKYESVDASIAGAVQYNGNISQQIWATSTTVRHAYGYNYDALNQLSSAVYEKYSGSWNQDAGRFTESATYDLNGNILTMIRGGKTGESTYGSMDNITMSYAGNKLIGANDAVTSVTGNYQFHEAMVSSVVEGNTSTHEYRYDVNGNMVKDLNKGITLVEYNYLNLPTKVEFGEDHLNRIEWAYTVTGAKLRKTVYTNGAVTLTQDYVSGFVYKNGSLDFFSTETGRVKNQSGTLKYQYTLTDHLGNTRVMFADTGSGTAVAIEESHYYAFGMRIEGLSTSSPDNKFTYNGKELMTDFGLGWYEYGWRMYDPQIGRWHAVDPIDEFYSPYCYVGNNPINFIDPDGMGSDKATVTAGADAVIERNSDGQIIGYTMQESVFTEVRNLEFYNIAPQLPDNSRVNMHMQMPRVPKSVRRSIADYPGVMVGGMFSGSKHYPREYGFLNIENQIIMTPGGGAALPVLKNANLLRAPLTKILRDNSQVGILGALGWAIKLESGTDKPAPLESNAAVFYDQQLLSRRDYEVLISLQQIVRTQQIWNRLIGADK